MALVLADRVKETTSTTGSGSVTLAGASAGFQSFSVIGDTNTTYYAIVVVGGTDWEVGVGTYSSTGTSLSRDTVSASSNSGSLVNFPSGTKDVFSVYPAAKSVYLDAAGNLNNDTTGNAATATVLETARTIAGQSFNGSANISIAPTDLTDVTATAAEINVLDGITASTAELNIMDGVTATTAELNIMDGVTATASELNIMDGVTATTTELNYVDGVTSSIQTQLDNKDALGTALALSIALG